MNKKSRSIFTLVMVFAIIAVLFMMGTGLAFADEETAEAVQGFDKGLASAIAIGLASMGGAVAMGIATGKSTEAISRQPEAEGKITSLKLRARSERPSFWVWYSSKQPSSMRW